MRNITVNFKTKTIDVTNAFSKRAGVVGSVEYQTLVEVMRAFPDYALCIKLTPSHHTLSPYGKLTYADMEEYINKNVDESQRKEKLLELKYNKEILGFFRAKALFIKEFMMPEESKRENTVA